MAITTATETPAAKEVPSRGLAASVVSSAERQVVLLLLASFVISIVGELFVDTYHVQYTAGLRGGAGTGLYIRLRAVGYGLPLILAFLRSWTIPRGPELALPFSRSLDIVTLVMSSYWFLASLTSLMRDVELYYWLSTTWYFQVPALVYFSIRRLRHPQSLEFLTRWLLLVLVVTTPLRLVQASWAFGLGMHGFGGPTHLFPLLVGLMLVNAKRPLLGWGVFALAFVGNLIALKRAIWIAMALLPLFYGMAFGRRRRFLLVMGLASLVAVVSWRFVPTAIDPEAITNRARLMTDAEYGYGGALSRYDEVRSIWTNAWRHKNPLAPLIGMGMGATYTFFRAKPYPIMLRNYHHTHFTPGGWFLRGGFAGTVINCAFYFLVAVAIVRRLWLIRDHTLQSFIAGFAAFYFLSLLISASSFCLTPNVVTHGIAMLALLFGARPDEPQRLSPAG